MRHIHSPQHTHANTSNGSRIWASVYNLGLKNEGYGGAWAPAPRTRY